MMGGPDDEQVKSKAHPRIAAGDKMNARVPLRVCVLGGRSEKIMDSHQSLAAELGTALGGLCPRLISGGPGPGQAVASAGISAGAGVTEVVTYAMLSEQESLVRGAEIHVVRSAHQQNELMYFLAHAIVVMPGGLETLGALTEMIGLRDESGTGKPMILLDSGDYFDQLVSFSRHLVIEGFVTAGELGPVRHVHSAAEVCAVLSAQCARPPAGGHVPGHRMYPKRMLDIAPRSGENAKYELGIW